MDNKRSFFIFTLLVFVIIGIWNPCGEEVACFIRNTVDKNVKFLELVTEIKLILAAISKIEIPFLSGHSNGLENTLEQAQAYLVLSELITFVQFLLIEMAQLWFIKLILIILFFLVLIRKFEPFASKLLIIFLVLSPGISIIGYTIKEVSQHLHIDYSDEFLVKLEASVRQIKSEQVRLMHQHQAHLTEINNDPKRRGARFFPKLAEDITYDIKKEGLGIKGDFKEIRLFLSKEFHVLLVKSYNHTATAFFSFLLLPALFLLVIYSIYKTQFQFWTSALNPIKGEFKSGASPILKRLKAMSNRLGISSNPGVKNSS